MPWPMCQQLLKHILIECHKYDVQRPMFFGNNNITLRYKLLEADTSFNGNVNNFIQSINISPEI